MKEESAANTITDASPAWKKEELAAALAPTSSHDFDDRYQVSEDDLDRRSEKGVRLVISYLIYPFILFGYIGIYILLSIQDYESFGLGLPEIPALSLLNLITIAVIVISEFVFPYKKAWNKYKKVDLNDIVHLVLVVIIGENLARFIILSYSPYIMNALPDVGLVNPGAWPLAFQLLLGIFIYDFVYYWYHRLFHHSKIFWRSHRFHHAATKLNFTKTVQFNSLEVLFENVLLLGFLKLSGIGNPALIILFSIVSITVMLKHSNIYIRYPAWMDFILVNPYNHRLHHSTRKEHYNLNYGGLTMIWDVVFGTYRNGIKHPTTEVGLEDYKPSDNVILQVFDFLRKG